MAQSIEEQNIRLSETEVKVGVALPWDTFDLGGRLLLREGVVINSDNQLRTLLERGMYRHSGPLLASEDSVPPNAEQALNPITALAVLVRRSQVMLHAVVDGTVEGGAQSVINLCMELQALCAHDADAVLAAMHLDREGPYPVAHSLYCALLTEFITVRLGFDAAARLTAMAAAFTANVGMLELQERLLTHQGPLPEAVREDIRLHPQRSVSLLERMGVDDVAWLAIVAQHHEKSDGSGYHRGLSGNEIREGARVVGVADRYHAMISDRVERMGLAPTTSLRKMFTHKEGLDEACVRALIKEIGIYPPGIYVRLINGEIGVVTRRGRDGVTPLVTSLIGPRGAPYDKPIVRDCGINEYTIKEMVEPLDIPLSELHGMWGYEHLSK
jgi:HD-GYP domain-containing protein (c-di-GMP phosphodiesterase class II)